MRCIKGTDRLNFKNAKKKLRTRLSEKRFTHTLGVVIEAKKLARFYGGDIEKSAMAALLHDCAKNLSASEILKKAAAYDIILDKTMKANPFLAHGIVGAEVAKREYGVSDPDILSAIACHTTGKPGMSRLDKIIFLADCIEPYREEYPGLAEIRAVAYSGIDKAMVTALGICIEYVKRTGHELHPLGAETLSYFENLLLVTDEKYGEEHTIE